jgi:hypothetical protein
VGGRGAWVGSGECWRAARRCRFGGGDGLPCARAAPRQMQKQASAAIAARARLASAAAVAVGVGVAVVGVVVAAPAVPATVAAPP